MHCLVVQDITKSKDTSTTHISPIYSSFNTISNSHFRPYTSPFILSAAAFQLPTSTQSINTKFGFLPSLSAAHPAAFAMMLGTPFVVPAAPLLGISMPKTSESRKWLMSAICSVCARVPLILSTEQGKLLSVLS